MYFSQELQAPVDWIISGSAAQTTQARPMNMQVNAVMAPPAPKSLEGMQLPIVMMRDIMIKSMFRTNMTIVSDIARVICLPIPLTQVLIEIPRSQRLI